MREHYEIPGNPRQIELFTRLETRLSGHIAASLFPHKVMRLMQNMPELWTHHHKIGATTTTHASQDSGRWAWGVERWVELVPSQISAIPDETRHNPIHAFPFTGADNSNEVENPEKLWSA